MRVVSIRTYLWLMVVMAVGAGCGREEDPFPADNISGGGGSSSASPASIAGLHRDIFAPKCAIPSCHGGTFEPDFRTIESTYYTLVYQPVTKNTIDERFRYRVIPGDTVNSWLFHRVTVEDTLIPRMPIYMDGLTADEVGHIRSWIMAGAPDADGHLPQPVNVPPTVHGYTAYNSSFQQIDNLRASWSDPFPAPANETIHFWVYLSDPESQQQQLALNRMKFSLDPNNFSNAITATAVWMNGPVCWGWVASVNTSQFPAGSTVYMRYEVKDPVTKTIIELPNNNSYSWLKTNFSFTR
ncbi:MAG: hypothetical protein U0Y08_05730 [Bacteroidia bacterium]